jgi:hypothetical protein
MSTRALIVALFLVSQPCQAVGVVGCLVNALRAEMLGSNYTSLDRDIYFYLHDKDFGFSEDPTVRKRAFSLFSSHQSAADVVTQFSYKDPATLDRALKSLEEMPEIARSEILRDPDRTRLFWQEVSPAHGNQDIVEPVVHEGKHYSKKYLDQALKIQDKLKSLGVQTEIVSSKSSLDPSNGQALLRVISVKGNESGNKVRAHRSVFTSSEFNRYLAEAAKGQGGVYIDPALQKGSTLAYFHYRSDIPGEKWRIALGPDATWSEFIHEWEHKLDSIDRKNVYPDAVYDKVKAQESHGPWKRAALRAGHVLERGYISELNATAAQFRLYFKSKSGNPKDIFNTIMYRTSNQQKVAIGRMLQDPLNPKHYILYVGSQVVFVGTIASLVYAPAPVFMTIEKLCELYELHRYEQSYKKLKCDALKSEVMSSVHIDFERMSECGDLALQIRILK